MNPTCITCGTTHDGEFCPKPPQPVLSKDSKPMINKPAEEAFKTATTLTRLHAKLDVAKDAIACALDELPASFDEAQFKRINEIRNTLHQEMSRVFEFSKAEAHRICNQLPESSPAENRQLAGSADQTDSPDDWVTQDLVPGRPGIDQWRWWRQDETDSGWGWSRLSHSVNQMHGFIDSDGDRFEIRCRRKNLPTKIAASDSPAPPEIRIAQTDEHFPVDAELLKRALEIAEFTRNTLYEMEATQRGSDQYSKTIKSQIYIDFIDKKKSLNFRLINDLRKAIGLDK